MIFQIKKFQELTLEELYQLLKIRYDVFVNEQQSIYNEFDNKDQQALHIYYFHDKKILAYSRLYATETKVELGRIVTANYLRGSGVGGKLIQKSIAESQKHYPGWPIEISAQQLLKNYYQQFGFQQISEPYDDGGIMHIDMVLMP